MKKRIFAFIICVVVLVGVLPLTASAAYALSSVKIDGLSAPVEGFTPDYKVEYDNTVTLDAGNNNPSYYSNGICWYDMTTGSVIRTNTGFVRGHQYKAMLYLYAKDGYYFPNSVKVWVDGVLAVESDRFNDYSIVVEVVFDAIPDYIDVETVEYRLSRNPVAGDELETVTLMRMNATDEFGDILDWWDGAWYVNDTKTDNPADYEIYNGSTYVHSVAYAYCAEIVLDEGYRFAGERYITLNTTTKTLVGICQSISSDGRTAVYWFFLDPMASKPISEVFYTVSGLELGGSINGISVSSDSGVNIGSYGSSYFVASGNRVPIMTGNFESDTYYRLYIAVTSDKNDVSTLTKDDITMNGKNATATEINNGTLFAIFNLDLKTEIFNVILVTDDIYPVAGEKFFYPELYAVNADENMKSAVTLAHKGEKFGWYVSDYYVEGGVYEYVGDTDRYEAGKAYLFFATIYANEGYVFTDDSFVTISTPDGLVPAQICSRGSDYIQYEFYYNLGAPDTLPELTDITVELKGYEYGKSIVDIEVTPILNGQKMSYVPIEDNPLYGSYYVVYDSEGEIIPGGKFEYDTNYIFSSVIFTDGYDISTLDPSKITLDGKPADAFTIMDDGVIVLEFILPRLSKFTDVKPNHWFAASVAYCVEKGYVSGMTETTFVPNGKLTRAQFLTILAKLDGVDLTKYETANSGFTDVKTSHWYNEVVCWAVENGITSGLSKTQFGPNNNVTRAQLARFFFVYSEKNGVNTGGRADISAFPDVSKVADWAKTPIEWAVNAGLISGVAKDGKNYLDPNGTATRAQATVMFKAYDDFRNN